MSEELHWKTVSETLAEVLKKLMQLEELTNFRLVGGTSLCLQLGHRESYDIDMFTDMEYGTIDFGKIDGIIRKQFAYVDEGVFEISSMGFARLVGNSNKDSVKIDMFYTDPYIRKFIETEGIRMASVEDIAAMKLEVILRAGRKKDFWDIHELMESYSLEELLMKFGERYPYHREEDVLDGLTNFSDADNQLDPICLKRKFWELIKYDIEEIVKKYRASH